MRKCKKSGHQFACDIQRAAFKTHLMQLWRQSSIKPLLSRKSPYLSERAELAALWSGETKQIADGGKIAPKPARRFAADIGAAAVAPHQAWETEWGEAKTHWSIRRAYLCTSGAHEREGEETVGERKMQSACVWGFLHSGNLGHLKEYGWISNTATAAELNLLSSPAGERQRGGSRRERGDEERRSWRTWRGSGGGGEKDEIWRETEEERSSGGEIYQRRRL